MPWRYIASGSPHRHGKEGVDLHPRAPPYLWREVSHRKQVCSVQRRVEPTRAQWPRADPVASRPCPELPEEREQFVWAGQLLDYSREDGHEFVPLRMQVTREEAAQGRGGEREELDEEQCCCRMGDGQNMLKRRPVPG